MHQAMRAPGPAAARAAPRSSKGSASPASATDSPPGFGWSPLGPHHDRRTLGQWASAVVSITGVSHVWRAPKKTHHTTGIEMIA